jgi:hypothetical protein
MEVLMSPRQPSRSSVFAARLVTLFLIASVAFGLVVLVKGIVGAVAGGQEIAIRRDINIDTFGPLPPNVVGPQFLEITVRVKDPDVNQALLGMFSDLIPVTLGIAVLWLMRSILGSVRKGDPFTWGTVRRLRAIGFVLLIGAPIAELARDGLDSALSSTIGASGFVFNLSLNGPVMSLFVFVLAQVFAEGIRLREDVEGTV